MTIRTKVSAAGLRGLVVGMALIEFAAPAGAQSVAAGDSIDWSYATTFDSSTAAADTAQYLTIETCLAAIDRTYNRTKMDAWLATKLWPDSLPPNDPRASSSPIWMGQGHWRLTPLPDTVVATARACTKGITPEAALGNRGRLANLVEAYLAANRDAEVTALVAKQLASLTGNKRRDVEDTVLGVYRRVQPVRQAAGEALLEQRLQAAGSDPLVQIPVMYDLFQLAQLVSDTAALRKRAKQMDVAWQSMPAARRDTLIEAMKKPGNSRTGHGDTSAVVSGPHSGRQWLHWSALLDSVKRSTVTYLRAAQVLVDAESVATDTGEVLPPVIANYWFPQTPGDTVRPRRGRVEVIIDLRSMAGGSEGLCASWFDGPSTTEWKPSAMGGSCVQLFATLRRLGKRFPELGITVVAYTGGVLFQRALPDPAGEAEMLRHWFHDVEHLPGTLAVIVPPMPFPRRPAPDRRVDFSCWLPWGPRESSTVVGRDGRVIAGRVQAATPTGCSASWIGNDRMWVSPNQEEEFTALIEAALQQPK